jgi:hypothetical protein
LLRISTFYAEKQIPTRHIVHFVQKQLAILYQNFKSIAKLVHTCVLEQNFVRNARLSSQSEKQDTYIGDKIGIIISGYAPKNASTAT